MVQYTSIASQQREGSDAKWFYKAVHAHSWNTLARDIAFILNPARENGSIY